MMPTEEEEYAQFVKDMEKMKIDQEKENKKKAEDKAKEEKAAKKAGKELIDQEDEPTNRQNVEIGSEVEKLLTESLTATVARQHKELADDPEFERCALLTLRVRHYDIKSAAPRLVSYLQFRKENKVSEWTPEKSPICKKILERDLVNPLPGLDKEGRLVMWIRKQFDDPKSWKAIDMIKTMHYVLMTEFARRDPKVQIMGLCGLLDMHKASHKNMDMSLPKLFFSHMSKTLPFRIGQMLLVHPNSLMLLVHPNSLMRLVHPNSLVSVVLPVVKSFAAKKLADRIHVIDDEEKLTHFIDKETVPEAVGGALKYDRADFRKN
eukprot:g11104.t1